MSGPRPPGNDLRYQDTMSRPDLFESGLQVLPSTKLLDALIHQHLETASHRIKMSSSSPPTPPPAPISSSESATLLNELGDYFARTARMWSSLTESLMDGPHIDNAMNDVHHQAGGTYYADFSAITDVDVEIGRLRKIRDLTAKYSREVQEVWRPYAPVNAPAPMTRPREMSTAMESRASLPEPASPMADVQHHVPMSSFMSSRHPHPQSQSQPPSQSQSQSQSQAPETAESEGSDDESDDEELFANIDMTALSQRGKGNYHCPKGLRCDKGGVDKDGKLVVFDRNSSFAQHCNKHRKPWRCELPGCPNPPKKRRFARRDGLERHKSTVKHYVMG